MPNASLTKAKLNRADKWRTLVTDTSPFEVPIIFSNDGFYRNITSLADRSSAYQGIAKSLALADRRYTEPLRYNIVKDANSVRTLSLLHPHGQIAISDFYNKYDQLICEYGQRSPYSMRKPSNIGRSFYFRSHLADKNKYKNDRVDTTNIDRLVRNPASYFSYSSIDRLYKFFRSDDYVRLEKKFKLQMSLDITKCFDSIYTHSITWATKDQRLSKDYSSAASFGSGFDRLMQKLNYNETKGICIGPETSRLFAEIILAKADLRAERNLRKAGIRFRSDYECRRYVDNYYVFANSDETLKAVKHEISIALQEFKLHLNEAKTEVSRRPFYSQMSLAIDKANASIQRLWHLVVTDAYKDGE